MSDHWEKEARDLVDAWFDKVRHVRGQCDISSAESWIEGILTELSLKIAALARQSYTTGGEDHVNQTL